MNKESLTQKFLGLFHYDGRIDPIVLTLYLVINLIVLANSILHYPKIGYDAVENLNYIQILPDRLPSRQDTYEFFSPPLPYFLPSRFDIICEKYASDTFNNKNDVNSVQPAVLTTASLHKVSMYCFPSAQPFSY